MKKLDFKSLFAEAQKDHAYWVEGVILEFTEDMVNRMEEQGVSRSELARRIGVSPAYITKILRGSTNFTLDTMVKVARALDCELRCHLQPDGAETRWFDVLDRMSQDKKKSNISQRVLSDKFTVQVHREEKELVA